MGEEGVQGQREFRQGRAGECAARPVEGASGELAVLGLLIDFDLLLWAEDEPTMPIGLSHLRLLSGGE